MAMQYPATALDRPAERWVFGSSDEYLSTRGSDGAMLCEVVEKVNYILAGLPGAPLDHFPWVTIILGSGATGRPSLDACWESGVCRALQKKLNSLCGDRETEDGIAIAKLVEDFTRALIADRLDRPPSQKDGSLSEGLVDDTPQTTLQLLLLSGLLTRLYHSIKGGGVDPVKRLNEDPADEAVLRVGSCLRQVLDRTLVDPAREAACALVGPAGTDNQGILDSSPADPARCLVKRLRDSTLHGNLASDRTISLADLRSLTELAWFHLTEGVRVYPGWGDLLFALSLHAPSSVQSGRPFFTDTTRSPAAIKTRYEIVTRASMEYRIRARQLGESPEDAHTLAAKALLRQAALRRLENELPVPSAFVAGYDLETEMALWDEVVNDTSTNGYPDAFVMAIPVNVVVRRMTVTDDSGKEVCRIAPATYPCWLGRYIKPEKPKEADYQAQAREATNALQAKGRPEDWFVLSIGSAPPDTDYAMHPVIVRLSGCPLIQLPEVGGETALWQALVTRFRPLEDLNDTLQEAQSTMDESRRQRIGLELEHAVLLNEHDAIRHSTVDLYHTESSFPTYGLPVALSGSEARQSRFWMLLGVQVADSGLRTRLAIQMASPAMFGRAREGLAAEEWRAGVAVNMRIAESELDLFHWHGLDVIKGVDCQEFAKATLIHYNDHLECAIGAGKSPPPVSKPQETTWWKAVSKCRTERGRCVLGERGRL